MNNYIKISFSDLQPGMTDILIAQLSENGYDGFEEKENGLDAFIPEESFDDQLLNIIIKEFNLSFTQSVIQQQNWNALWESNFHPVVVDDFAAVRADFHEPIKNVQHEIVIMPKMSFGTGHHATTYMMMQQMQKIDFDSKTVFDFGTGTGILAILAYKCGASSVTAIDNDEWSIRNAAENFEKNNCTSINLQLSDKPPVTQTFDIILANITKNIILENFALLSQQMNKNAILLISGLLQDDEKDILDEARKYSLNLCKRLQQGNWLCMRFLR